MSRSVEACCDWGDARITGSKAKQQSHKKDEALKAFCAFIFFICPEHFAPGGVLLDRQQQVSGIFCEYGPKQIQINEKCVKLTGKLCL